MSNFDLEMFKTLCGIVKSVTDSFKTAGQTQTLSQSESFECGRISRDLEILRTRVLALIEELETLPPPEAGQESFLNYQMKMNRILLAAFTLSMTHTKFVEMTQAINRR